MKKEKKRNPQYPNPPYPQKSRPKRGDRNPPLMVPRHRAIEIRAVNSYQYIGLISLMDISPCEDTGRHVPH